MPQFSYTSADYPFQPFTKIYSADINQCLADVSTFLNTTKLDSSNIQAGGIATANLADGLITQAKLAARSTGTTVTAGGVAISVSCGNFTTSSTSFVSVTNLSVTLTTTGRPVRVLITSDAADVTSGGLIQNAAGGGFLFVEILRASTPVYFSNLGASGGIQVSVPVSLETLDVVSAGTYTYSVKIKSSSGSSMTLQSAVLVAYEI